MADLWSTLVPLIVGSALVPIQIIVTVLLLRSSSGMRTAVAWIAGMTTVRLLQGVVFGLVLSASETDGDASSDQTITSVLLLVVAVLFLVTAARKLLTDDDPDDPPPKWLTATETMSPGAAFLFGAGLITVGAKFWVFTLGAISAIGDADLGRPGSIATFLAFVVLAQSVSLALIALPVVAPHRSDALLDGVSGWLERHNRVIVVAVGFVFGTWFLLKALDGLGVL